MRTVLRVAVVVVAAMVAAHCAAIGEASAISRSLAAAGLVFVVVATALQLGWCSWAGAGVLGVAYTFSLAAAQPGLDPLAPVVAVALYLVVELLDVGVDAVASPKVRSARVFRAGAVGCAGAVVATGLLVLGAASPATGTLATVAMSACGCVLLVTLTTTAGRS